MEIYEALYGLESVFEARTALTLDLLGRLRQTARLAPERSRRERLTDMTAVLQDFVDEAPELVRQNRERRRA